MLDVLIRHGWVIDGTGNPPYPADVAIEGERIAEVGRLEGAILKMTSMPATHFGLRDRGLLRPPGAALAAEVRIRAGRLFTRVQSKVLTESHFTAPHSLL